MRAREKEKKRIFFFSISMQKTRVNGIKSRARKRERGKEVKIIEMGEEENTELQMYVSFETIFSMRSMVLWNYFVRLPHSIE